MLVAPPGTGKSTLLPAMLLDAPWRGDGSIILLEPRRLAARLVAARLAQQVGTRLGDLVGYTIRHDRRRSPATRLEVVTEGVLVRRLQRDPTLDGVSLVILDEFHERSLEADLLLALIGEVRAGLRPDLRLLVMSATPDLDAALRSLNGAPEGDPTPVITVEGRLFPVEVRHRVLDLRNDWCAEVADAVAAVCAAPPGAGDVLVFLPGAPEVHRVARRLGARLPAGHVVRPLTGRSDAAEQDAAINPDPSGRRRIILSTAVAETSITIEGVGVVVDGGRSRRRRVDPATGIGRLETTWVSRAAAEQRRGRAGRLGPGVCIRLWPESEHRHLPDHDPPEIAVEDLTGLALTLAAWGCPDGEGLPWPQAPDASRLGAARDLLGRLGFVDGRGRITEAGRTAEGLGIAPRSAAIVAAGAGTADGSLAVAVAAAAEEGEGTDLAERVERLLDRSGEGPGSRAARDLARRAGAPFPPVRMEPVELHRAVGRLAAAGFPDRLAHRRADGGHQLPSGRVLATPPGQTGRAEWLVVLELDDDPRAPRIHLAAELDPTDASTVIAPTVESEEVVAWDGRTGDVVAVRRERLETIVLGEGPLRDPDPDQLVNALLDGVRAEGLSLLGWSKGAEELRDRVRACARHAADLAPGPAPWPDWSDAALSARVDEWLGPHLRGCRRRADLRRVDVTAALRSDLPWPLPNLLEELAPLRLRLPSGRSVALDWSADPPVLAARVQDCFGLQKTPMVLGGRVAVVVHLLSPAGRTAAVTSDLAGFWTAGYRAVRSELRGRYPRHDWPEDPSAM